MKLGYERKLYENPQMWEKRPPDTVLQRLHLTVTAVPPDVEFAPAADAPPPPPPP